MRQRTVRGLAVGTDPIGANSFTRVVGSKDFPSIPPGRWPVPLREISGQRRRAR
jgi:hypothetical protein